MLREIKQTVLRASRASGVFSLVSRSRWRQNRLLILGYHGVALEDEHQWNPGLYITQELFAERMDALARLGCNVLALGEALERLRAGQLPERSVAITFDDGFYDFYKLAYPIIKQHKFPVTLYLTTYYASYNRPVFDVICSYLIWKGSGKVVDASNLIGEGVTLDLTSEAGRALSLNAVKKFAQAAALSAEEKDALASSLARLVGVDYEEILEKRILHLLKPEEVRELAEDGVDIQLHTHRHRTPQKRELFLREIEDNRHAIEKMANVRATHFCYPSGHFRTEFLPWLEEAEVASATTCGLGFATQETNKFILPRLLDRSHMTDVEFEGWVTGLSNFLPKRAENYEDVEEEQGGIRKTEG
ncbi:MAG: hypothetical protein AUG51_26490 [Acidobacteria bacterium 13_1_20CM_3_53_8]|nr:MAG: hypothetical protein AUG51_26490 [Acidobacteria bacterium 13_1_20CM_3_53_8]